MWRCFCFLFVCFKFLSCWDRLLLLSSPGWPGAQVGPELDVILVPQHSKCQDYRSESPHLTQPCILQIYKAFSQSLRELSWSIFLLLLFPFTYRDKVPCSPGWPQTSAEDDLNTCFSCLWSQGPALQMCTDISGFILRKVCVSGRGFCYCCELSNSKVLGVVWLPTVPQNETSWVIEMYSDICTIITL